MALLVFAGWAAAAAAEPAPPTATPDGLDYVVVPADHHRRAGLARVIFLNRCPGGCTVGNQRNDSRQNQSTIPKRPGVLSEFPFGDQEWDKLVQCVRHAYSLYDVTVTDQEPDEVTDHIEVMVAGTSLALGFEASILGISPLAEDCSPVRNVLSFAFAAAHFQGNLNELCSTVVHEAGHTFGLDHALQCRDPMTYLVACGDRLFLNIESQCGEFRKSRFCRCSDRQNSHVKLLNELGPSGLLPTPGTVEITSPASGETRWTGDIIAGRATDARWIRSIELWINGFRWAKLPHQIVVDFHILAPEVSDGILDLEVRAYNDLGAMSVDRRTLLKGTPCETSASCAAPERCQEGRCMYPTPVGLPGQTCTADSDCASWECQSYAGQQRCSQVCLVGANRSECAADSTCVATEPDGVGMCWPTEELPAAGCCDAGGRPPSALALLLVALGLRRRRRTADAARR
ncbi:MAG: hypothetical protein R3B48_26565 [Kofleriaceae bacterium]